MDARLLFYLTREVFWLGNTGLFSTGGTTAGQFHEEPRAEFTMLQGLVLKDLTCSIIPHVPQADGNIAW
jgi:hypothetical protein